MPDGAKPRKAPYLKVSGSTPMGSQHPSPNVIISSQIRAQIWLEIITSRDAKSACFKGSRMSCREIIFGIFWPNFGQKRSHHVTDASCRPYPMVWHLPRPWSETMVSIPLREQKALEIMGFLGLERTILDLVSQTPRPRGRGRPLCAEILKILEGSRSHSSETGKEPI